MKPTKQHTVRWRGLDVTVSEFCEPTDIPWDGDHPLEPGSEGFDLSVDVELSFARATFKSGAQVGSNWISPDNEGYKYLDEQMKELVAEALSNLGDEVSRVAGGADVMQAEGRRAVARVVEDAV